MKPFLRNNGLSIAFLFLFLLAMTGQLMTGHAEYNQQLSDDGAPPVSLGNYLHSGHFIQATFENWESEFLQMALFVVMSISLRQKGSSESKSMDEEEAVDRDPDPQRAGAPWPVRKGGFVLWIYKNSLTLVFLFLFLLSFLLHFYGALKDENTQRGIKSMPPETLTEFLGQPRFWFESFQNWQSEFLSVFCVVIFSIFLRQKGSPQSKPVDAPDTETGE